VKLFEILDLTQSDRLVSADLGIQENWKAQVLFAKTKMKTAPTHQHSVSN
jgi:hypothetical protein